MIPLTVDVPMQRLPWANWGLILITVAISLAVPALREELNEVQISEAARGTNLKLEVKPPEFSPLVLQRAHFQVYQLVTALFQHADLLHLIGNMVFLFVFGNAINAKLGHLGFLTSYLAIGILVNLVWLAIGAAPACLGASAAIMGLCGMFLVLYPRNDVVVFWDEWEIAWLTQSWTGTIPGWAIVLLFLAFDVWGAIFDQDSGIGYVSHIVGALLGVSLVVALLKQGWLTPDLGEQTLLQWLASRNSIVRSRPASAPVKNVCNPEDPNSAGKRRDTHLPRRNQGEEGRLTRM